MSLFDISQKHNFDDSIRHVEVHTHFLYTKSFGNNGIVKLTVNQSLLLANLKRPKGVDKLHWRQIQELFFSIVLPMNNVGRNSTLFVIPSTIRVYLCYAPKPQEI